MSESRQKEKSQQSLARGIRSWHVSLIALGGIIGSCYFLGLGLTFSEMGAGAVLIAYIVAGITIYGVMQSFAELLVNIPRRGSFVSYTREFMGDVASTGIGWAFWVNWVCYVPSEALATAVFMNYFVKLPFENPAWSTFVWGIIALALLTAVNLYHVKWIWAYRIGYGDNKDTCNSRIFNLRHIDFLWCYRWKSSSVYQRRRFHRNSDTDVGRRLAY